MMAAVQASVGSQPAGRSRARVSHEIIAALRQEIASGRVPRGARLPNERNLADRFGVSQPTVREAMRALDVMGLVEVKHGSGAYAASNVDGWLASSLETLMELERVRILDVLEIREVLGARSAYRAVRNATASDIEQIDASLKTIGSQTSVLELATSVVEFQTAFSAAAHEPLLTALESFLIALIMRYQLVAFSDRNLSFWRNWTDRPHPDRIRIVKALRKRDEKGTVRAMNDYLSDQRVAFKSNRALARVQFADAHWMTKVGEISLVTRQKSGGPGDRAVSGAKRSSHRPRRSNGEPGPTMSTTAIKRTDRS